nr:hypothetical protein [Pyrinomonadaceae bacterium]
GTNGKIKEQSEVSEKTLREMVRYQKIANDAVQKAQEENRRLGIPNWYSINGEIISDIQIKERSKKS